MHAPALPPFQRFLDEHRDAVWGFLAASVGPVEADDCFQETFLSALKAYPRVRADSNLRAWVLTIAHRKAIDAHRRRTRRAVPTENVEELAGAARPSADGRDEELWSAVRALPPRQRAVVLLRYVADLSHAEIAQVVGTSEEAARSALHSALNNLRKAAQP